jgi:erythromycin esterase-like protein
VYPEILNKEFCQIRDVRKTLWRQPNIKEFHSWLKREGEKKDVSQQLHRSGSDAAEQGWGRFDK